MLKISRKKVKTVYALMHIAIVAGVIAIILFKPLDAYWLLLPFVACFAAAVYCDWWIKEKFRCPNCTNCLVGGERGGHRHKVVDPLNQYDRYCSVCGEEIKIEFTD